MLVDKCSQLVGSVEATCPSLDLWFDPNLGLRVCSPEILNFSNPESGTFWVNLVSQNLEVALLNSSNPESGTFWASVSGQKALFAVNLGSLKS